MRVMHKLAAEHEVTTQLDYNPWQKEKDDVIDTLSHAPKCTTTSAMAEMSVC